jgi:hypothetical protein
MSDSWLKLVGNILIATDEYVQFLKEQEAQEKTESVRSDTCEKTGKASECSVSTCRYCGQPVYLEGDLPGLGPTWKHSESERYECRIFATPSG